jgi:protein TonB
MLVCKVLPEYPELARVAHISGSVVLSAIIDKKGEIKYLWVISGHPLLVQAAIQAVQRWRYKPWLLNHEPIEVEIQVTMNFTLERIGG